MNLNEIASVDQLDLTNIPAVAMEFTGGMVTVKLINGTFRRKSLPPWHLSPVGAYQGKKQGVIFQFTEALDVRRVIDGELATDLIEVPAKQLGKCFTPTAIQALENALHWATPKEDLHAPELTADLQDFGIF